MVRVSLEGRLCSGQLTLPQATSASPRPQTPSARVLGAAQGLPSLKNTQPLLEGTPHHRCPHFLN